MDTNSALDKQSPRPLYNQLKDYLVALIESRQISIGGRIPSEEYLAGKFHISRMTVRQALDSLSKEVPLVRVKGKGTYLANTPSGRTRRSLDYVRVIIPHDRSYSRSGDFYLRIFHAVEEEARKNDIDVIFSSLDETQENVAGVEVTEGVIFVGILCGNPDRALVSRGIPTAFVDGFGSGLQQVSEFHVDSEGGAQLAVKHLVDMGHCRIGILTSLSEVETPAFAARLRGYRKALAGGALPSPDSYVQHLSWEDTLDDARRAADSLLGSQEPPTAVFAADPFFATRFLAALAERGMRVPERLSLITLGDDNTTRCTAPPLSSVRLFEDELGRWAVRHLILQAEMPDTLGIRRMAPVELVSRSSVRPHQP